MVEPLLKREKYRVFLNHLIVVPEISRKEYAAHKALEKNHGRTRDVLGIEEVEDYFQLVLPDFKFIRLVTIMAVNVWYFGVLIEDEFFGLMGAMNFAVIPQWGQSFVVI